MKRIIPRNLKVSTEFFRGVSLTDILVGFFGVLVVSLILLSSLPGRLWIAFGIALVFGFLLLRIDDPNYMLLFRILQHFSYIRRYRNLELDVPEMLEDDSEEYARSQMGEEPVQEEAAEEEEPAPEPDPDEEFDTRLDAMEGAEKRDAIIHYIFDNDGQTAAEEAEPSAEEKKEEGTQPKKKFRKAAQKTVKKYRKTASSGKSRKSDETGSAYAKEFDRLRRQRQKQIKKHNDAVQKMARHSADIHKVIGVTGIRDGFLRYHNDYFGAAIEIPAVEFRFFSQHRRQNSINHSLGNVIRSVSPSYSTNLVKVEQPMLMDEYIDGEYEKLDQLRASYENGILNEDELKARVELIYSRIDQLEQLNSDSKILTPHYYLVFYGSDKRQLDNHVSGAIRTLEGGEMHPHRLNDKELAVFLRYTNSVDFDEHEIDDVDPEDYASFILPDTLEIFPRHVQINHIMTHNFRVNKFPLLVDDAWGAPLFDIPGTKVVVKFTQMDQEKSIRAIDRSISELQSRLDKTDVSSRVLETQTHIETLQELLSLLNNSNECLMAANIYVTAYDINATRNSPKIAIQPEISTLPSITNMKREIRRTFTEQGFRLNDMLFQQFNAFVAGQVNGYDPLLKDARGMPGSTLAALFPWVFANLHDAKGITLGSSDGVPSFIDFFRRDHERVNSNMVVVGKSGGGKSFAVKSLLANLAADDSKIFVLDPENEYTELAGNLSGKFINVANASNGRINPFHILTSLEDDELEVGQESSSYAAHLQFLEEFFRQILPEINSDAMEYLNNLVNRVYSQKGIDQFTNLSTLRPEDYPTFDDLYDCVLDEFMHADSNYIRSNLRVLVNYIAKFSTGGRNAGIWNGPSTLSTLENFIVFNFQSLLANRNNTIANAQMLLVLKYLDNEIIKNRDYNLKNHANRRVIVVIDEAHVFIDSKYPLALDFMYQLAKRIRKYNGMQIVITQNIKDFVGSEELARKSTAIINACQYSFIFSLAPNDMADLCTLYEKAGGINEGEQEQIINAGRGQAFVVTGPSSRTSMQIETPDQIQAMFSESGYVEKLYSTATDRAEWNNFVGDSREIHEEKLRITAGKAVPASAAVVDLPRNDLVELIVEEAVEEEDEGTALLNVPEASLTPQERANATERSLAALHREEEQAQSGYFGPLSPQGLQQFGLDALISEIHKKVEAELMEKLQKQYGLSPVEEGKQIAVDAPSPVPAQEANPPIRSYLDKSPEEKIQEESELLNLYNLEEPGSAAVPENEPESNRTETVPENTVFEEPPRPEEEVSVSDNKPEPQIKRVNLNELDASVAEQTEPMTMEKAEEVSAPDTVPEEPEKVEEPASAEVPVQNEAPKPRVRRITLAELIQMG